MPARKYNFNEKIFKIGTSYCVQDTMQCSISMFAGYNAV